MIKGEHFTGTRRVNFGPNPARSFRVVSAREIRAATPSHSGAGTVNVRIATPYGGTSPESCGDRFKLQDGVARACVGYAGGPVSQAMTKHVSVAET